MFYLFKTFLIDLTTLDTWGIECCSRVFAYANGTSAPVTRIGGASRKSKASPKEKKTKILFLQAKVFSFDFATSYA
jgi:hypothetical protein